MESNTAATSDWASFWANLSSATSPSPRYLNWFHWLDAVDSFSWNFEFRTKYEIHPTELSIHGRIVGKLRPPKLQLPRGYGNRVRVQRHEYSGPHFK